MKVSHSLTDYGQPSPLNGLTVGDDITFVVARDDDPVRISASISSIEAEGDVVRLKNGHVLFYHHGHDICVYAPEIGAKGGCSVGEITKMTDLFVNRDTSQLEGALAGKTPDDIQDMVLSNTNPAFDLTPGNDIGGNEE